MAGGWPIFESLSNASDQGSSIVSTSAGTVLTASSSTNIKGVYKVITTSSTSDIQWIMINLIQPSSLSTSVNWLYAVDVSIGATGSEKVIIPNLLLSSYSFSAISRYMLPIPIPQGTQIQARVQASVSNISCSINFVGFDSDYADVSGSGFCDSLGFNPTSTEGVTVTTSSGAKGAYSQIISATSYDYSGFVVMFDSAGVGPFFLVDIAIGPSGSEVVVLPNIPCYVPSGYSGFLTNNNTPFIPIQIPAGTRIAARASSSGVSRTINVTLLGVRL